MRCDGWFDCDRHFPCREKSENGLLIKGTCPRCAVAAANWARFREQQREQLIYLHAWLVHVHSEQVRGVSVDEFVAANRDGWRAVQP